MWTCPQCARTLTKPNIWHQCIRKAPEELCVNKAPIVATLLQAVNEYLSTLEGAAGSATKNCMVYVRASTFAILRPMKSALDIKLYLPGTEAEFPVYKTETWGKRTAHFVRLHDEGDFDESVRSLLRQAYDFSNEA
ncbi:MAG: hypothetical protein EOO11_20155 [Chitinophagaceae bacterium]|nr:MAG: hypothetical protein EOO11_20155 [Chitinophagaceae bacterium]